MINASRMRGAALFPFSPQTLHLVYLGGLLMVARISIRRGLTMSIPVPMRLPRFEARKMPPDMQTLSETHTLEKAAC